MKDAEILNFALAAGGTVSAGDVIASGALWEDLYRLRDSGTLVVISRGIYRLADAPARTEVDLLAVCRRAPKAMICLSSAASYWELTDEIPAAIEIAVPRGAHRPQISFPPVKVHLFAASSFELGRVEHTIGPGEVISISSAERTVVDLMRLAPQVGRDQALHALSRYVRSDRADPAKLVALARRLRAGRSVAAAVETLLA